MEIKQPQVKRKKIILFAVAVTGSFFQVRFYSGISPPMPNGLNILGVCRATQLNDSHNKSEGFYLFI